MPEFFYYYVFPLSSDDYHYIWAADNMMVFEYDIENPENMRKVVDILNGSLLKELPNVTLEYPDIKVNGQVLVTARGLERLILRKGLEEGKALDIQKQFLEFCVRRLSGKL